MLKKAMLFLLVEVLASKFLAEDAWNVGVDSLGKILFNLWLIGLPIIGMFIVVFKPRYFIDKHKGVLFLSGVMFVIVSDYIVSSAFRSNHISHTEGIIHFIVIYHVIIYMLAYVIICVYVGLWRRYGYNECVSLYKRGEISYEELCAIHEAYYGKAISPKHKDE